MRICHCRVPKYVDSDVNCSDCIITYAWHYNGTTQKPHDHLFKKSRQAWLASFALKYRQNPKKWGYIISVYPNMLPVVWIVLIVSLHMHGTIMGPHRSPMTNNLKSWGRRGLLVSRWNIDKSWKREDISLLRTQIFCQSVKLFWVYPHICLAL